MPVQPPLTLIQVWYAAMFLGSWPSTSRPERTHASVLGVRRTRNGWRHVIGVDGGFAGLGSVASDCSNN